MLASMGTSAFKDRGSETGVEKAVLVRGAGVVNVSSGTFVDTGRETGGAGAANVSGSIDGTGVEARVGIGVAVVCGAGVANVTGTFVVVEGGTGKGAKYMFGSGVANVSDTCTETSVEMDSGRGLKNVL